MQQWGLKLSGSAQIDKLTYSYQKNAAGIEIRAYLKNGFIGVCSLLGSLKMLFYARWRLPQRQRMDGC